MVKIGVIGAGILGGTLARHLAAVGNTVQVANSHEPESLSDLLVDGMSAGWAADVAATAGILFLALPYSALPTAARSVAEHAGPETIIVDTGNYYPGRDGILPGLGDTDTPEPDTLWLSGLIGRPIFKAFNNITYVSLRDGGRPAGSPQRFGLPIAGPDGTAKHRLSQLVDQAGFDPVDGGTLAQSWRQQPGSPVYATDLPAAALRKHLDAAQPQDPAIYRANRAQFDDVTAAGYDTIRSLREQGLSFDQIIDAMAADTEDAVSKVHDAQK
ncbi:MULTISPECIES: NADPH-dependent F420 reductase [Nocardia]|uniref:NADP oxidoreductase coenzyme F420-dependent n=2 Tax=Nocardia TaxID=1817 RepID=K0EWY7_NOCB7|nr:MULTISPECIES: NAD(P)-binding domain-containing protein [Nocardia]AFU01594.1 NADP oxidoreductase coenzyme F420-dependent [Nocardia brasiliensis ATCC 700358]KIA62487.1 NADP oxidoreductase [Nocardia vulneris]OCF85829.1 NADP oxidoreductase [Nocardia brasiliensis]